MTVRSTRSLGEPLHDEPEQRRASLHPGDNGMHGDRRQVQTIRLLFEAEERDEFVQRAAAEAHEDV